MALPTTNLVAHFDASDTDNLFTTWTAGGNSGVPSDDDEVQAWEHEGDGSVGDRMWVYESTASNSPRWRSVTPLMQLPCLEFDNEQPDVYGLYSQSGGVGILSDLISASACTIAAAFRATGGSANSASPWLNHVLFGELLGYFSLGVRADGGGNFYLQLYNWDGNLDVVEIQINLFTNYVVIAKHAGGNLDLTLITDGVGSESSATPVASGEIGRASCRERV